MVFTIADLHLSTAEKTNKPMAVFGKRWCDHAQKIEKNWRAVVNDDDTVIIPGDISWALTLEESYSDLKFIDSLPGRKLIGKGNHDFWWSTMAKLTAFCTAEGIQTIDFLYNNAYEVEDFIVCGTRGWFGDPSGMNVPEGTDYDKIVARESNRLRMSLNAAVALKKDGDEREILVFLHFPPVWNGDVCRPFVDVLQEFSVKRCFFGHIHGVYTAPHTFDFEGISFSMISADYLNFAPMPILPLF